MTVIDSNFHMMCHLPSISTVEEPSKFAASNGFEVVGTQVLTQSVKKDYRSRSNLNLSAGNPTGGNQLQIV